jgi:amidase
VGDVSDGQARVSVLNGAAALIDAFVERFVIEPTADGELRRASFAVKDLFDVAGHRTGCGNPTWAATHPPASSHAAVVQLLLRAGARLIGKTRTDEMAYSIEGRNFHEGAPRNPAAPDRLTGGSSSGSASATAAGEVDFAIGTDTAGSVRVPAAWCGLFGLRPTHGRVTAAGLTPLAPSFDSVGWLARSSATLHKVGGVLLGEGAIRVSAPSIMRDSSVNGYADAPVAAQVESMFEACAARGFKARDVSLCIDLKAVAECLRILQGHEAWNVHGRWIGSAQPQFGPGVAERFAAASVISANQVSDAARERAAIIARLDAALPLGVMLCLPTVPAPAPRRDAAPEELQAMRARLFPLTALASLTGRPQITLPLPAAAGAPLGFSLLGWRNGDEALLEAVQVLAPP